MVSIVSRAVLSKLNFWSHLEGSSADCRSTEVYENLHFRIWITLLATNHDS